MTKTADPITTSIPVKSDRFVPSKMEEAYHDFLEENKKNPENVERFFNFGKNYFTKTVMITKKDSFLTNFLINIRMIPDLNVPTAGVGYEKDSKSFYIVYNPLLATFFSTFENKLTNSSNLDFISFVLYHEIKHIVYNFFGKQDFVESLVNPQKLENLNAKQKFYLKNVAHDLSINSILSSILDDFFKIEDNRFGHFPGMGSFKDYPPNLSMEEYFIRLLNDDEFMDKMKSSPQFFEFDDHQFMDMLDKLPEEEREILKNELRQQITNALNKSLAAGTQSNAVLKSLSDSVAPPPIDAESVLGYFIEKSVFTHKKPTMKKLNKKVPYVLPGKNKNKTSHLALCVDQSGSVDDLLLTKLLKVCDRFLEHTTIDLIPFDCGDIVVDKIKRLRVGDRVVPDRVLQGGTDFNKPTDYVNEVGIYDGMIIMTDLQASMPGPCSVDRMWVSNTANSNPDIENSGEIVLKFSA